MITTFQNQNGHFPTRKMWSPYPRCRFFETAFRFCLSHTMLMEIGKSFVAPPRTLRMELLSVLDALTNGTKRLVSWRICRGAGEPGVIMLVRLGTAKKDRRMMRRTNNRASLVGSVVILQPCRGNLSRTVLWGRTS